MIPGTLFLMCINKFYKLKIIIFLTNAKNLFYLFQ